MSNAENPKLFGVWKAYKSENVGDVMAKAGAPWIARKMAANATPTMTLTREDDTHIRMTSKTMVFTVETVYTLNDIIQMDMPQQNKQDVYTEWQDGKLVCYMGEVGSDVKNSGVKQIRSIEENGDMLMTLIHAEAVGYRWFRREG